MEAPARISAHRTTRRWTTSIAVAIGLPLSLVLGASTPAHADHVIPDLPLEAGHYTISAKDNGRTQWLGVRGKDQVTFATTNTPVVWYVSPNKNWLTTISTTGGRTGCIQRYSNKKSNKLKNCSTDTQEQIWHIGCYSSTNCDVVNEKTGHHLTIGGNRDNLTYFTWVRP